MKTIAKYIIVAAGLLLGGLAALTPQAHADGGVPLWTNRYDGPGLFASVEEVRAVTVDSSGNVFVTGYSSSASGYNDFATVAYSSAGLALWTNRYNGSANGYAAASALAVDTSGNVFVTGSSDGSGTFSDYATIKYSSSGAPLWTNYYNGPGNDQDIANAIALNSSGNVFVTGLSYDGLSVQDYATVAYSNVGVPLWTNRYNGPGNSLDVANAIALDSSGNVFVTGTSYGTNGYSDYATVAYSNAGVPMWTNRYNSGNGGIAKAVAVDSSGNVFVTGGVSGGTVSGPSYATVAYSIGGSALWTNHYNGPAHADVAVAIAVDRSGNVIVTGNSGGTNGYTDYATIKYSSSMRPPVVNLDFQRLNNQLLLSWTNASFSLQSALAITGTFTSIAGATSPYTNDIVDSQQYFRLKAN